MGIVDWFTNDMNTEERTLTRDLLSVAIANNNINEEEQKAIKDFCEAKENPFVGRLDKKNKGHS